MSSSSNRNLDSRGTMSVDESPIGKNERFGDSWYMDRLHFMSVISLVFTAAAMFVNADDHLSNCV